MERQVRYIKENLHFMTGRTFTDLDDLNHKAHIWQDKVNTSVSQAIKECPLNRHDRESLLSLPDPRIRNRYRYESRSVLGVMGQKFTDVSGSYSTSTHFFSAEDRTAASMTASVLYPSIPVTIGLRPSSTEETNSSMTPLRV